MLIAAGIYVKTQTGFWILGAIIGLILGGSQATSRSMLTLMIPAEKAGEYFGFFALAGNEKYFGVRLYILYILLHCRKSIKENV